jgi:hypothetical protein
MYVCCIYIKCPLLGLSILHIEWMFKYPIYTFDFKYEKIGAWMRKLNVGTGNKEVIWLFNDVAIIFTCFGIFDNLW